MKALVELTKVPPLAGAGTGHCSLSPVGRGIDAEFNTDGRTFTNRIGVKGSLFHYVYGFQVDDDGVRRFHQRRPDDGIDDFEAVHFDGDTAGVCHGAKGIDVILGRQMFTRNQLLNKQDRILDDLTPTELAAENRKQF